MSNIENLQSWGFRLKRKKPHPIGVVLSQIAFISPPEKLKAHGGIQM